jgi:hypothetical protein
MLEGAPAVGVLLLLGAAGGPPGSEALEALTSLTRRVPYWLRITEYAS